MELVSKETSEISPYYVVKCLFVGKQGVGKSSLIHLLNNQKIDLTIEPTIGIEFDTYKTELIDHEVKNTPKHYLEAKEQYFDINSNKNYQIIKAHIWDSSGAERFSTIVSSYTRDVDIAFLVFDVTDRDSWKYLEKWKVEFDKVRRFKELPLLVLIGTKNDLHSQVITSEEIERRRKLWNAKSFVTSNYRENASGWTQRILKLSIKNYHERMLELESVGERIPDYIKNSHFEYSSPIILFDGNNNKSSFCCFQ